MRKFATDLIAGKLLTKSNNKIANLGLGYLQNLLWTILVANLAAKITCEFRYRKQTCKFSYENYLRI